MRNWKQISIGEFIDFNPPEKLDKGKTAKKIPMAMLTEFERKIEGFEFSEYQAGPKFRNGDTLVAKITPCLENGKTAQVDILEEGEVAFGSSEFIVLRENRNSIKDYIFYLAKSPLFRERAISCMEGTSGRKRVNEGALKRQEIRVPDKSTQQKIAAVLSALDDKIELNNKINPELEAMAKTLYDYWFVQFDFPTPSPSGRAGVGSPYKSSGGKMVYNATLKREIPEGWEVKSLEHIADIVGGSTPSKEVEEYFTQDGGISWITPKDLSMNTGNKFIDKGEFNVTVKGMKNGSLKVMPTGTVLMSSRAPIGYLAISSNETTTNQGFKSFIPKNGFPSEFIYYGVKNLLPAIVNNASGSTFKEVSGGTLKTLSICTPPKEMLKEYSEKVGPIFKNQENLEKQKQELSGLRDWLLPMLMNGQVSVGKVYEMVEEVLSMAAEGEADY